jgi:hypothetical protein
MKRSLKSNKIRKLLGIPLSFLFILFFTVLSLHGCALTSEHIDSSRPKDDNIQCVWSSVRKIIAVGDLHGDFDNFVEILKEVGLIDQNLSWQGGDTHLVQMGDIMDRGPDAKKIFDLIKKLEIEAVATGGRVHMLIGNHEEMNITGMSLQRVGYVTPEQLVSFLPEKYREKKEKKFLEKIEAASAENPDTELSLEDQLNEYWRKALKTDKGIQLTYTENFNKEYGKWIRQHNAVIKINDVIFVHGGINKKFSTWELQKINERLRKEFSLYRMSVKFSKPVDMNLQIIYNPEGPLWYRDLTWMEQNMFKDEVDQILNNLNARHMVVAHTPQVGSKILPTEEDLSRFDGRIWAIDTGISEFYGGHLVALIIENDNFSIWSKRNEE